MAVPQFSWGCGGVDSETFITSIRTAYIEVVHWRRNIFSVPSGSVGKAFVNELARFYCAYADSSKVIALSATTIFPILLLQKPHRESKTREHIVCLERRLKCWEAGDIESLLQEGRTIQHRIRNFCLTLRIKTGLLASLQS